MTTTLTRALTTAKTHLDAFSAVEKTLPGHDRPTISRQRRSAIARFGELGFPNERNEDWKFTSVNALVRTPMHLVGIDGATSLVLPVPPGVIFTGLTQALADHPDLVEPHLGQYADFKANPFVALNSAFWADGAFLYVPPGTVVETPIPILHVGLATDGEPAHLRYRRVLIVVGQGAQVTIAEHFSGGAAGASATNAVSEIILGEGAVVDHYKVQEEPEQAYHLATTQVVVPSKATFSTHYVGLGSALTRNEVRVVFTGDHAEATVNGLYLARGSQHMDNHTVIDHAKPHCASHELYKGILDDKARGVFNGKIFVRLDAQKTDAKQTNKTLLLSDDATINTKPQLEIFADDVKCTHGATVGQLDEQQLFYLRSRGIGAEQARALLTYAFANDIVNRIKVPALRQRLEKALLEASHLPRLEEDE